MLQVSVSKQVLLNLDCISLVWLILRLVLGDSGASASDHLSSVLIPLDLSVSSVMDKDNRDDFTFAKLSDLKLPVTFRMYALTSHSSSHLPTLIIVLS
jgi:hypothetical protein